MNRKVILLEINLNGYHQDAKSYVVTTRLTEPELYAKIRGIVEWVNIDDQDDIIKLLADSKYIEVMSMERYNC